MRLRRWPVRASLEVLAIIVHVFDTDFMVSRISGKRDERSVSDADELTVARLAGAAQRHAPRREPTEEETAAAVAELREIADGRGDLLAEAAGLLTGFYRGTAEEARAAAAASTVRRVIRYGPRDGPTVGDTAFEEDDWPPGRQ